MKLLRAYARLEETTKAATPYAALKPIVPLKDIHVPIFDPIAKIPTTKKTEWDVFHDALPKDRDPSLQFIAKIKVSEQPVKTSASSKIRLKFIRASRCAALHQEAEFHVFNQEIDEKELANEPVTMK
jgi:hypothetical protein